ncbi:MAG: AAA family ATPase [Candidatus Parvarchaeota archaeon]|nr:AAA family ATPase [Candidatus Jingweiarchaeum tengchongense]MCW1298633.1 AAA family ATPase [Candidatus Jingweiarchaeum tengchongense]MCW1300475.1 AAA family ATPase [Candidatus Jingweiarchaeum tengchongense]MCW1304710.1 AAA family ATPase [Candidatus Jingweiarchaeum tengchongense]MCW1306215.1 AAA family ATPase [Candidatus Jingweiarchaeum tengchongense]
MTIVTQNWFERYGFKANPFTLRAVPDEWIVGFDDIIEKSSEVINACSSLVIYGPIGSGKTTILRKISSLSEKGHYHTLYLNSSLIKSKEELIDEFINTIGRPNVFEQLRGLTPKKVGLMEYFRYKIEKNKICILLDEAQDIDDKEMLRFIRTFLDSIPTSSIIIASLQRLDLLPIFIDSLRDRIVNEIELRPLKKEEAFLMIKTRIENVGGRGIDPFETKALEEIFEYSKLNPRTILVLCERVCEYAVNKGKKTIDSNLVNEFLKSKPLVIKPSVVREHVTVVRQEEKKARETPSFLSNLSPTESKFILELVHGPRSSIEIQEALQSKHGTIAKIAQRLMLRGKDKKLMIKKGIKFPLIKASKTRPVIYELSPEIKKLFAKE